MVLKYTDVDYHVFTDASKYVLDGQSPYLRPTYRYSPLLAWLVLPCHLIHISFGKIMFSVADIATAISIQKILQAKEVDVIKIKIALILWLFNPITMVISSRGNAESIMSLLVVGTLYLLHKKQTIYSGLVYGLSVHFKIFPIIYALPFYLFLGSGYDKHRSEITRKRIYLHLIKCDVQPLFTILLSKTRLKFFVSSALSFCFLTAMFYVMYGYDFLEHAYLYHVTRKDIRHNFSIYFYLLYTNSKPWLELMCFINQSVIILCVSFGFYEDVTFCCFILTFLFVCFNKICTSQYFVWYLTLVPFLVSGLSNENFHTITVMFALWGVTQSVWLSFAYNLEFLGHSNFLYVWMAGVLFFISNVFIANMLMKIYKSHPTFASDGNLNSCKSKKKSL